MKEEPKTANRGEQETEPALTPLGTLQSPPVRSRAGDMIHTAPEFAIGEGDVRSAERVEFVAGTSLWRDAWRRLLKNKLAVFGMIVVVIVTVVSLLGPYLIKQATGYTPDYIPSDVNLLKSLLPFKAPGGSFS